MKNRKNKLIFSLRDVFWLMIVIACLTPKLTNLLRPSVPIALRQFECGDMRGIVQDVDPEIKLGDGGGGSTYCNYVVWVPNSLANSFWKRLDKTMRARIANTGWKLESSHGTSTEELHPMFYEMTKDQMRSELFIFCLSRKDAPSGIERVWEKDLEEFQVVLHCVTYPRE